MDQTLIKAPSKAARKLIEKANAEYKLAFDGEKASQQAKLYSIKHVIASGKYLLKLKEEVGYGGWEALFEGEKRGSRGDENPRFWLGIGQRQSQVVMKAARFPHQAIAAALGSSGLSFNLDRTYAALSGATKEGEKAGKNIALLHTGDEESYTPSEYIEAARLVLGRIDLDPASNALAQETVLAGEHFDIHDDGLSLPWSGTVWLNPPFTSRVIDKFLLKLIDHYTTGDVSAAIALTNNNTDTKWFHSLADAAAAICFTAGRINFVKKDGARSSPTNGQCFFYLGDDRPAFAKEFSRHGRVMVDWE